MPQHIKASTPKEISSNFDFSELLLYVLPSDFAVYIRSDMSWGALIMTSIEHTEFSTLAGVKILTIVGCSPENILLANDYRIENWRIRASQLFQL